MLHGLKKNYYTSATVATSDQYRSQALQSARGNQHVSVKAQQVSVLQGSFSWLYIEILGQEKCISLSSSRGKKKTYLFQKMCIGAF